MPTTFSI